MAVDANINTVTPREDTPASFPDGVEGARPTKEAGATPISKDLITSQITAEVAHAFTTQSPLTEAGQSLYGTGMQPSESVSVSNPETRANPPGYAEVAHGLGVRIMMLREMELTSQ